jgi:hypothetical protein
VDPSSVPSERWNLEEHLASGIVRQQAGGTHVQKKDHPMATLKPMLAAMALLAALAVPAAAQQSQEGTPMTAAECQALFQQSDTNGDGVLSQHEIAAADLEGIEAGIGLSAFMTECQGS